MRIGYFIVALLAGWWLAALLAGCGARSSAMPSDAAPGPRMLESPHTWALSGGRRQHG